MFNFCKAEKSIKSFHVKCHTINRLLQSNLFSKLNWFSISTFPTPTLSLPSVHSGFPPSKQRDSMAPLCAHGDLIVMMMSLSKVPLPASRPDKRVLSLLCIGLSQPSSVWHNTATLTSSNIQILNYPQFHYFTQFSVNIFLKLLMLICVFKCQYATNKDSQRTASLHNDSCTNVTAPLDVSIVMELQITISIVSRYPFHLFLCYSRLILNSK